MSTKAYTYGYGICVEKIKDVEKDRLLSLIRMAPEFYGEYQEWEEEWKLGEGYEPDVEDILVDFVEDCAQFSTENLASILQEVIKELEGIELTACEDWNHGAYLVYEPDYPWNVKNRPKEQNLTEEDLVAIFAKYLAVGTDSELDVDYQKVEYYD